MCNRSQLVNDNPLSTSDDDGPFQDLRLCALLIVSGTLLHLSYVLVLLARVHSRCSLHHGYVVEAPDDGRHGVWATRTLNVLPFAIIGAAPLHPLQVMAWRTYLSRHVRELRFLIHMDMSVEKSAAIRSYIQKNYDELKMLNPATPFLVRDGWPDGPPQIIFTYDWGKEVIKDIDGLNEEQIDNVLKEGVKFGETLPKYWDPVEWKPLEIVDGLPKPEWY